MSQADGVPAVLAQPDEPLETQAEVRGEGTTPGIIDVLIVDDDALVRSGLRLILGGDPTLRIVAEAGDGDEALVQARRHRPDVVLMDIRMPRRDGIGATSELRAQADPPAVIVLTTFDTDDLVVQALRAGASGFLLKDTPPDRIVEAIHRVHAGDPMLSPTVTAQLISAVASGPASRAGRAQDALAGLTDREREVAVAIGQGLTNAEIAAAQYLSVATVKSYVSTILAKLDAQNRVQIAIRVHDAGLL